MLPADPHAFARSWCDAWNAHDLDAILGHYASEVVMSSPFAAGITGHPVVHGRSALRAYWAEALRRSPDLRLELLEVVPGADGLVLRYRGLGGRLAEEALTFGDAGCVVRAAAHYGPPGRVPSEAFLRGWLDAWSRGDVDEVAACYAPTCRYRDPALGRWIDGADALHAHVARLAARYAGWSWALVDRWVTADATLVRWRATFPTERGPVEREGLDVLELRDDRIAVNDVVFDARGL